MNTALPPSLPPSLSLSLSHSLSLSRSFPYSRLFPPFPPTRSNKPSKDRQSSSQTDSQTDSHTLLTRTKKHSNTFEQAQIHSLERSKIHPYEQRKARTNTPHTLIWLLNYSKIYPQQWISRKLTIFAINNNTHTHNDNTHARNSIDRPTVWPPAVVKQYTHGRIYAFYWLAGRVIRGQVKRKKEAWRRWSKEQSIIPPNTAITLQRNNEQCHLYLYDWY